MKRLMMAAVIAFLIIQTANLAKAESKTSCESTQFKIVMKSEADVKEKASAASKTLKTYKKNKELSASGELETGMKSVTQIRPHISIWQM
ncbi:hypothetical protein ACIQY5_17960 [Peribacillus frigoritolerans]|uniref:hypothetical protein n=1 Tax=Peribacillus frigoritolerans TaxID=450367 RepID=UPI0037F8B070